MPARRACRAAPIRCRSRRPFMILPRRRWLAASLATVQEAFSKKQNVKLYGEVHRDELEALTNAVVNRER